MPVRRKATGRAPRSRPPPGRVVFNRPDTSVVLGPRGGPRGSGESVEMVMHVTSAFAGTLDAASAVNGPRDFPEHWDQVDWARVEEEVRRLVSTARCAACNG